MSTLQQRIFLLNSHGDFDPVLIAAILGVDSADVQAVLADPEHAVSGGGGGGVRPLTAGYALDARSGSYAWERYTDDIGLQTSDKLGHLTLALPGLYWARLRLVEVAGTLPTPLVDCLYWLRMNSDFGEVEGGEGVFVPGGQAPGAALSTPTPTPKMFTSDGTLALAAPSLACDSVPLSNRAVLGGWSDGVTAATGLTGLYFYNVTYFG